MRGERDVERWKLWKIASWHILSFIMLNITLILLGELQFWKLEREKKRISWKYILSCSYQFTAPHTTIAFTRNLAHLLQFCHAEDLGENRERRRDGWNIKKSSMKNFQQHMLVTICLLINHLTLFCKWKRRKSDEWCFVSASAWHGKWNWMGEFSLTRQYGIVNCSRSKANNSAWRIRSLKLILIPLIEKKTLFQL